ncbi:MAG: AAA family ATPase [Candidatus Poribacteria bacterium]|nr:AAA family ATPase [Candidatus Poribacteria bacterium]
MPETVDRHLEEVREIRLLDYFWILFRNKWSVLLIFLLSVFVAFLITDLTPPVFQSETTIRVLDGQSASSLLSQLPISGLIGGTSVSAFAAQLQSRDLVITPAVRQLRDEGLLDPLPVHRGRIAVWLADVLNIALNQDATEQGELTDTEWEDFFIKTLIDEQLKVEESPDGKVITITVQQRGARAVQQRVSERAQHLANRIAAVFQTVVEAETVERMEWWQKPLPQEMLNQTQKNLANAEKELFAFQEKHPKLTLNAEGGTQAQIILALQVRENELINQLVGAELRRATYREELEGLSEELISETIARNPSHSKLQDNLNQYEIDKAELLGKYDETHPEVTAIDKKIAETEARLAKEEKEIKSTTSSYNPLHQVLTEKVNEAEAAAISFKKQKDEVTAQINAHFAELREWSPDQLEFYRLKRDVEIYNAQVIALETKMREAEIFAQARSESIKVMDKARAPEEPLKPRLKLNLVLGAFVGMLLGVTFAVAKNYFKDTYLRLEEAVRQLDALPESPSFLGVLPSIKRRSSYRLPLMVHDAPTSRTAEAFRVLQTKLPFLNPGASVKTILVTSATRGEGKSTISSNLAVTLAQRGNRVLLIDADMRRPSQHNTFPREQLLQVEGASDTTASELPVPHTDPRKPGLSEALIHLNSENGYDVLRATVKQTGIPDLFLVPSGTVPPNPIELLNSEMMTEWLELAKTEYDVIVIDSPPVRAVADPMILANIVDAIVYVFDITKTRRFDILTGIRHLTEAFPTKGIGVLCNMINPKHAKSYGYYSRHGSYYGLVDEDSETE